MKLRRKHKQEKSYILLADSLTPSFLPSFMLTLSLEHAGQFMLCSNWCVQAPTSKDSLCISKRCQSL